MRCGAPTGKTQPVFSVRGLDMSQPTNEQHKFLRAKEFNYVVTISLYGGSQGQQLAGKLNLGLDEMYVIALLSMLDAGLPGHPALDEVWNKFVQDARRLVMEYGL